MSERIKDFIFSCNNGKPIKYIENNGCWECVSHSVTNSGYIRYHRNNFNHMHRWIFNKIYGYLPEEVMHKCNNKLCINPNHLIGGTHKENLIMAGNDGLLKNPKRKLTNLDVKLIKYWILKKYSLRKIANAFNISYSTISQIHLSKTYKEVI